MKIKEEIVYRTESEENEELAESTGAFIDWLNDPGRGAEYDFDA